VHAANIALFGEQRRQIELDYFSSKKIGSRSDQLVGDAAQNESGLWQTHSCHAHSAPQVLKGTWLDRQNIAENERGVNG